jgi:hypothetical protein
VLWGGGVSLSLFIIKLPSCIYILSTVGARGDTLEQEYCYQVDDLYKYPENACVVDVLNYHSKVGVETFSLWTHNCPLAFITTALFFQKRRNGPHFYL